MPKLSMNLHYLVYANKQTYQFIHARNILQLLCRVHIIIIIDFEVCNRYYIKQDEDFRVESRFLFIFRNAVLAFVGFGQNLKISECTIMKLS